MNNRRGRSTDVDHRAPARPAPVIVELSDAGPPVPSAPRPGRSRASIGLGVVSVLAFLAVLGSALGESRTRVAPPPDSSEEPSAAELYETNPTAENLRAVLADIGGIDGVTLGVAEGSFALVTFDPDDPAQLIASGRSEMGWLERGDDQERWRVANGEVVQSPIPYPGVEATIRYNLDGTTTVAPRDTSDTQSPISILGPDGESIRAPAPFAASTVVVDKGAVFSVAEDGHQIFVDNGQVRTTLSLSGAVAWIEVHEPGRLVAYPMDATARIQVFDTSDFRPLPIDPRANHAYRRVAVEAGGEIGLGLRFDGQLERFDWATGAKRPFGSVDIAPVPQALSIDPSGRIALTVDRSGLVAMWFVGDDQPVLQIEGVGSADPDRPGAAVAADGTAVAVKRRAWPTAEAIWQIIDIDVDSWLARARDLGDRPVQLATLEP